MAQATRSMAHSAPARISDDPLENASMWAQSNARPIAIALAAIAVVAALIWGYRYMDSSKRAKASAALYQAQLPFQQGNMAAADTALGKVVERYGGTSAGQQAALLLAQARYEQGDFPGGLKALESALGSASDEFKAPMHQLMGMGYEAQNQFDKAAESYGKAVAAARFDGSRGEYKAAQARALQAGGKNAEARTIWEELAEKESMNFAEEARVRLGELSATAAPAAK